MSQPVGTGQAETSIWVVNTEGITVQCCQQLPAAAGSTGIPDVLGWLPGTRSLAAQKWRCKDVWSVRWHPDPAQGLLVRGQLKTLAQQSWQEEEFPMGWRKG